jgi:tetratricopeptide (TPR) repeat protein
LRAIQFLSIALLIGAPATWPAPPATASQRELTVVVVNAHTDPSQPVAGVRVSLTFVTGLEKVTDARDATNRSGEALLLVSAEAAQRGDLRIDIAGVNDLVVYEPADGQLNGLPVTVTIKLLPKGSTALLGPAQIEAMLRRMSLRATRLEQQNRAMQAQLAAPKSEGPDDLTAAMTDWAKANGFAVEDADSHVRQWAQEIESRKQAATADQKALAELALKHYGAAAQLFNQAAKDIGDSMDDDEKKFLEERRKKLRELVDKSFQSSNAYQLNLQYHQATQILEQASDRAAAEHGRYPEDPALRSVWLDALSRAAFARREEGEIASASDSPQLLFHSADDFRTLIREYAASADKQEWAVAQQDLGATLWGQGERSNGPQATQALAQSVEAYRSALTVFSKAKTPQDWANVQTSLGLVLADQGERSNGTQATALLAQSVQAYRAALEVHTKSDTPSQWAATQNDLANALASQGQIVSGRQASEFLSQAVQAYRMALEVVTRADNARFWAGIQNNLGGALAAQGQRASGAPASEWLSQAAAAYLAALEVVTKADLPQDWARLENNLGLALVEQSERSSNSAAGPQLVQAVEAFQSAFEVYTKTDLPQDWAMTQKNLGNALLRQGERTTGAAATDLLAQAIKAYRASLEVRTRADLPQDWAETQTSLGATLAEQGMLTVGSRATDLLAQSVEAYRAALEVDTRADLPFDWAMTEASLGNSLMFQGERTSEGNAIDLLEQSAQAYRASLEVETKTDVPTFWANTQSNLCLVLADQAERSAPPENIEILAQAAPACRAALDVRTKADSPEDWALTQITLARVLADQGNPSAAGETLDDAVNALPADIHVLAGAAVVYQNRLYRFDRAYQLVQRWLAIDGSLLSRLDLEDADMTTGHFDDCEAQAAAIVDTAMPAPQAPFELIRDTLKLACQWGAGKKSLAQQTAKALLLKSGQLEKTGADLAGNRRYLSSAPAFEPGRASWIALFDSLEKGDPAAFAAATKQLEEVMAH